GEQAGDEGVVVLDGEGGAEHALVADGVPVHGHGGPVERGLAVEVVFEELGAQAGLDASGEVGGDDGAEDDDEFGEGVGGFGTEEVDGERVFAGGLGPDVGGEGPGGFGEDVSEFAQGGRQEGGAGGVVAEEGGHGGAGEAAAALEVNAFEIEADAGLEEIGVEFVGENGQGFVGLGAGEFDERREPGGDGGVVACGGPDGIAEGGKGGAAGGRGEDDGELVFGRGGVQQVLHGRRETTGPPRGRQEGRGSDRRNSEI